jgi:hypothetical protein
VVEAGLGALQECHRLAKQLHGLATPDDRPQGAQRGAGRGGDVEATRVVELLLGGGNGLGAAAKRHQGERLRVRQSQSTGLEILFGTSSPAAVASWRAARPRP